MGGGAEWHITVIKAIMDKAHYIHTHTLTVFTFTCMENYAHPSSSEQPPLPPPFASEVVKNDVINVSKIC